MNLKPFLAVFLAFGIVAALGPLVIPALRKLKVRQTEREELKSHQAKSGTPTMGGIMILLAVAASSLLIGITDLSQILPVLLLTLGFGLVGFLDDFLKVVLRRSDGLLAWQKMLLQIVVTTLFFVYIAMDQATTLRIWLPGGTWVWLGWAAVPILYIAVVGTVNGVNFTDGLDGLSSSVTVPVAVFFMIAALHRGNGSAVVAGAVAGALLGFLLYNCYPAKVFMGDTGSLALGGFVSGMAYMLNMPYIILIVGAVYLVEVLSVMIQVSYFKLTHGKRIFRMAPIHHHFELGGWSETRVVTVFMVITILLCVTAGILVVM
ncbi:MAG: phospho-N-acetylmuramoyl-pentapeptide-transferase [Lachnospiraceae bacterium]|nr:phospho-N-acetylmuramoyl-pentapeptide-transferase [Lachnospiraceae bacterium]